MPQKKSFTELKTKKKRIVKINDKKHTRRKRKRRIVSIYLTLMGNSKENGNVEEKKK